MAIELNDIQTRFKVLADQGLKALTGIVTQTERATKGLDSLEKQASRVSGSLNKIGSGLAGFGAAITVPLGLAVKGAQEEAEALRQLEGTVNSTGESFEDNSARINSFIQGLTQTTKFADEDLIPALNRAVVATNDIDKAMRATELGTKLAAAGFGSLESNAVLVARVLEGQVGAIGRLIPEFRDLEDRLEAGATEADLAAEALARLEKIASTIQPPDGITQLTSQIGELKDAIGFATIEAVEPFIPKLIELVEGFRRFAETGTGKSVIAVTGFSGAVSAATGVVLLFTAQVVKAGAALLKLSTFLLTTPAGWIVLAGAVALASTALDELSKEADKALDALFKTERLAQFQNELSTLRNTIEQFKNGFIEASDAEKTFNKFGITGIEQAEQRIDALTRIIARLKEERGITDEATTAEQTRGEQAEKTTEQVIAGLEKERDERIKNELIQEEFARRQLERGKKLAAQVVPPTLPPPEPAGLETLAQPFGPTQTPTLADITTPTNQALNEINIFTRALNLILDDTTISVSALATALGVTEETAREILEKLADVGIKAAEGLGSATENAKAFDAQLQGIIADTLSGLTAGLANAFIELASGFDDAGKRAAQFFKNLLRNLAAAIAQAILLQAVLAALPGGGFFGGVKSLLRGFQDPFADMLARFEGSRFADLFFQGVTRELTNTRDRLDLALADNRDVVSERGQPISVIVNEATPETAVEFTDRLVEPRVRARSRQRSTRGELTPAEIDRALGTT